MPWWNDLTRIGKAVEEASEAASIAERMKMGAQAFGAAGSKKMLYDMGDFGKAAFDGMYASRKEQAYISGKYTGRFIEDIVPLSKNPVTNNLMFQDIWRLAEQKMDFWDDNLGQLRKLSPGETTAYLRMKYETKPSSNPAKWATAWDEVQDRTLGIRTLMDDMHAEASEYARQYAPGAKIAYEQNYLPHSWLYGEMTKDEFFYKYLEQIAKDRNLYTEFNQPDLLEAQRIYERDIAPNARFMSENLLLKRTANMQGYDMSPIAILQYIDDASKQMAEWKHLGEDYNKIGDWLNGIEGDAGIQARGWAKDFVDYNLGRVRPKTKVGGVLSEAANLAAQVTSLRISYFSSLRNLFQSQFSAFATSLPSYGKGIMRVFGKDRTEALRFAEDARVMNFKMPKTMMKSWPGRVYQGAITDFWAGEMGFQPGGGLLKHGLTALQQWHYKTVGMEPGERFIRSVAANTALEYLDELYQAAKGNAKWYTDVGGTEGAIKRLRELIDIPNEESMTDRLLSLKHRTLDAAIASGDNAVQNLVERARSFAAWQVVDDTQYGVSGRMRLPLMMQHPSGRFIMQFKTFTYRTMQMLKDNIWRNPKHFALASIPLLGLLYGEGIAFNELIKILYPGNKDDAEPGNAWRWLIDKTEPFMIMGVGDMFFQMIKDFADTGDPTKPLIDFFVSPVALKNLQQGVDVTITKRFQHIYDWDYDWKKYFDMSPSEQSKFIRAVPWPGPANLLQLSSAALIKKEGMKREEMDRIIRDFQRRRGLPTTPTTPPRIMREQIKRRIENKYR